MVKADAIFCNSEIDGIFFPISNNCNSDIGIDVFLDNSSKDKFEISRWYFKIEPLEDSYLDVSNYGIMATIVKNGKWGK